MSDTPRTDIAFRGDPSVGLMPDMGGWQDAEIFCRHLERQLNAALAERDDKAARINKLERRLFLRRSLARSLAAEIGVAHLQGNDQLQAALEAVQELKADLDAMEARAGV